MGAYKNIETEADEMISNPAFKLAVLRIVEQVVTELVEGVFEALNKFYPMRKEFRKQAFKKGASWES